MPNKSNNEIVLVLQHFENSVDKAVQAFLEGMRMSVFELKNGKSSVLKTFFLNEQYCLFLSACTFRTVLITPHEEKNL